MVESQQYVLSLSYGKDSLACLGAIEQLGLPLDRIVHAEVWATPTIPADLPEMVEFKKKADKIIKKRYGIEVEHLRSKWDYETQFYGKFSKGRKAGEMYGFPLRQMPWCNSILKAGVLDNAKKGCVSYVGIASDEPNRFKVLNEKMRSPLVEANWSEQMCKKWCEENDLLSPIYTSSARGGCWFCHNQGVEQLRLLRKNHPNLWELFLKWDNDSPVSFHADGRTVHDFDKRFAIEDEGIISENDKWKWSYLEDLPIQLKLNFKEN